MTARTSQALTEMPSRAAASSTRALRWSGRRSVVREVAALVGVGDRRPAGGSEGVAATAATSSKVGGGGLGDDELGVAAAQPHLDGARCELAR